MTKLRLDNEDAECIAKWGFKYHHIGIPVTESYEGEKYIPHLKMYSYGFAENPFGIEFIRFEKDSPVHSLVQKVPHVAFEVKNIEETIKKYNLEVITPVNFPSENVKVAMIVWKNAPVELIEFI